AVRGLLDNLRALVPQLTSTVTLDQVVNWLGVGPEDATLSRLIDKHREMATVPGRAREMWRRVTAENGRWWRLGWLAGLLIATPLLLRAVVEFNPYLRWFLGRLGPTVRLVLAWLIGIISWLSPTFVTIQRRLTQMESVQRAAEAAQRARTDDPDVVAAQKQLVDAETAVSVAEVKLRQAKSHEQQLTRAVEDLLPERRLTRFIEER